MAGINTYAGRLVGNEFILPKKPVEQKTEDLKMMTRPVPVVDRAEGSVQLLTDSTPWVDIATPRQFLKPRQILLILAVIFSFGLVLASATILAHYNPITALASLTSSVESRIQTNIDHPVSFVQPPYSVIVESRNLSSDIYNLTNQSISINLSFASVSPTNSEIAKWITTSKGPQADSTMLAINTGAVKDYLASLAKTYSHPPVNQLVIHEPGGTTLKSVGVNGISFGGITSATRKLSQQILGVKGAVISLNSKTLPFNILNVTLP